MGEDRIDTLHLAGKKDGEPVSEQAEQRHDAPEPTGNETVDAVLRSLEGLEDTPVAERVAVFESAHERLRAALAEAGDRSGDSSGR